ncbi:dipeptidyl peptidase III [Colletotrichum asianum]
MRNHPDTDRHESRIRTEGRDALLRACCGPTNAPRCVFEEGLKQFISIVEDRMLTYEDATKELMKMLNSSQPEYSYIDKQFEVTTKIVGFINTSANHQTTIDDVSRWLLKEYNVSTTDGDKHKDTLRHLVFAVMGWSTMLYTPSFTEPAAGFSTTTGRRLSDTTTKQTLTHSSMRPLGAVLRSHGLMPIGCPPGFGSSSGLPTLLTVTHLNFLSLSRLGDVTISWVDDLSKHCTFDRYSTTKELRLFRLPSLCAKIYLSDINEVLIGRTAAQVRKQ